MLHANVSGMAIRSPLFLAPQPTASLSPVRAIAKHTGPAEPHGTTNSPQLAAKGLMRAVRRPGGEALSVQVQDVRNKRSGRKQRETFR
jgi:hypothetical protein